MKSMKVYGLVLIFVLFSRIFSAVLGLYFEPGFIAAASYDKQLWMLDPRSQDVICKKKYHSQPLLSIAADDKYIITGSEDKVISIYDRAAGKNYKKITVSLILNPFQQDKILDKTKLKPFANDILDVTKIIISVF